MLSAPFSYHVLCDRWLQNLVTETKDCIISHVSAFWAGLSWAVLPLHLDLARVRARLLEGPRRLCKHGASLQLGFLMVGKRGRAPSWWLASTRGVLLSARRGVAPPLFCLIVLVKASHRPTQVPGEIDCAVGGAWQAPWGTSCLGQVRFSPQVGQVTETLREPTEETSEGATAHAAVHTQAHSPSRVVSCHR